MTVKPAEATPAPSKPRRLTPRKWAEAEALWETGEVTLGDLVKRFNLSERAFMAHFSKRGIKKGAKAAEHKKKVSEEVTRAAVDDATIVAARIKETKEEHYKMSSALAKLTWDEILTARKNSSPMAVAMNNLKALDTAMNVLKKAREERYAVLGLDRDDHVDEDSLPELVISELTADQIKALQERDHTEFDDLPEDAAQDDNGVGFDEDDDEDDDVVEEKS